MSAVPEVKICGLTRRADAEAAVVAGAAYLGVVLAPGGRRSMTPASAAPVVEGLAAKRVGVFVDQPVAEIADAAAVLRLDVVQLHGDEPPAVAERVRQATGCAVWKAIRPRDAGEVVAAVAAYAEVVDALLLDGWSAAARGGTGSAFDWDAVAAVRDLIPPPLRLVVAGGLTPENVGRAVSLLRPAVVDVSSGVEEAPGVKNPASVRYFVQSVQRLP